MQSRECIRKANTNSGLSKRLSEIAFVWFAEGSFQKSLSKGLKEK